LFVDVAKSSEKLPSKLIKHAVSIEMLIKVVYGKHNRVFVPLLDRIMENNMANLLLFYQRTNLKLSSACQKF
jgi:hypothetical protein